MDLGLVLRLGAVLALVAANAFFVAAEFALVSARRTRIGELADAGDRRAGVVRRAQDDLNRAISGTQLGITLASLGLGWIGEPTLARSLEPVFAALGFAASPAAVHASAIVVAFILITYLHVVLGELAPKTVALLRPEGVSRHLAGPLLTFNRVMSPAIWLLDGSARLFLRLIRVPVGDTHGLEHAHSPEEIALLVRQSLREGVVEKDEQAMIEGVFDLTHTVVREVMTPRLDIVSVSADDPTKVILEVAAESGFSRLPVTEDSLDEIVGIVVLKDLLADVVAERPSGLRARDMMREALFVPESKPIDDLLAEMRARKTHMAVVVDEFGGTDGIATLEDLLEEIVGEIYDEHDEAEEGLEVGADGAVAVGGGVSFADLLSGLGIDDLEDAEEYDTVAGFVIAALGRIPEPGDRVPLGGAELEVAELADRRITRLTLHGIDEEGVRELREAFGP
ncbi:hemolysin family protein [Candidatus Palauibacter sp.]|uniref:hemolysin family protein n=1 Tax=Candidatus Palauibacter sp. TaxID=3101350 RepID=UPI003B02C132